MTRAALGPLALALSLAACGDGARAPAAAAAQPHGLPHLPLAGVDPDVVAAIEAARTEVERDPTSGDAWGRLGNRLFVHDFLPQAARCFARAEELDPERYVWTYRRGLCLIDDEPEEAATHLARALRSLDDHAPAHETYAQVLMSLGRLDEALAHYERASALDPASARAETGRGQVQLARGELEAARARLEEAVRRDPRHAEAHVALAQAYLGLGRDADAHRHAELSRTLPESSRREDVFASPTLPPAGARARTRYGRQLERQGQLDEAREQYEIALGANPDFYQARWSLAALLARRGERDAAVELLREAERRNPEFDQVRRDLARLQDPAAIRAPGPADDD